MNCSCCSYDDIRELKKKERNINNLRLNEKKRETTNALKILVLALTTGWCILAQCHSAYGFTFTLLLDAVNSHQKSWSLSLSLSLSLSIYLSISLSSKSLRSNIYYEADICNFYSDKTRKMSWKNRRVLCGGGREWERIYLKTSFIDC